MNDNHTANWWQKQAKHFQNLDILDDDALNPFKKATIPEIISELKELAEHFNLTMDFNKEITPAWCNYAHKIFEDNFELRNDVKLQSFHLSIHAIESLFDPTPMVFFPIHYFSKAGMLGRKITPEDKALQQSEQVRGNLILHWSELGKIPYHYFRDGEPPLQDRINALCKPFENLYVNPCIMLQDRPRWDTYRYDEFIEWWKPFEKSWLEFHHLKSWDLHDDMDTICIGNIPDIDGLEYELQSGNFPKQLRLS